MLSCRIISPVSRIFNHVTSCNLQATRFVKRVTVTEKPKLYVEKDPEKLVNYVCGSNIFIEGEDIKLKDDSEYPEWLFKLHTGKPLPLNELDPNTICYWRRVRKMNFSTRNKLKKAKKFDRKLVNDFDFRGGLHSLK